MPNSYGELAQGGPTPQLDAYGNPVGASGVTGRVAKGSGAADIDHVNIWMRSQPWYHAIIQQNGGHADSDAAKQAVMRAAQAHGVQVDQGNFEIDNTGNIRGIGHKLRNTLIVAGIAAATIATMGAAGVFAAAGAPGVAGTIGAEAATSAGVGTAAAAGGVGLGGAAAAGGATAAVAGSAPSWLGPVLQAGIPAAGTVAGSAIAAHANTKASELQAQLTREALEYEKQRDRYFNTTEGNRYAAMMNAEQPYIDTGRSSAAASNEMMGLAAPSPSRQLPPPPTYASADMEGMNRLPSNPNDPRLKMPGYDPNTGTVPMTSTSRPAGSPPNTGGGVPPVPGGVPSPPNTGGGQTVMMRAPDGSTKAIPADQAAHFEQMGAKRMG